MIDLYRAERGLKREVADVQPEIDPLPHPSKVTPALLTLALALIVFGLVMYYLYQQYASPPPQPTPTIVLLASTPTPTPQVSVTPLATRVPTPSSSDVTVPEVAGLTLQEADDALRLLGLRIEVIDRQFNNTVATNIVLSQTVKAQTKVQKDSVIGVTLSRGSQLVAVPRLVGLSYNDAVARLAAVGLRAQKIDQVSPSAANTIVGQDPPENAQLAPNSAVRIMVSMGDMVTVPPVKGMELAAGKDVLLKAGFVIGQVSFQGNEKVPPADRVGVCEGCIVSTDPSGIVKRGAVINIGVWKP